MSLSSATNRNDYAGNGSADTYNYTFRIFDQDDLRVIVADSDGVETVLDIGTDYTVTGVGAANGGSVVLVDNGQAWIDAEGDLDTGYSLTVRRVLPVIQETDIRNQGAFYPEIHEDQFDKLIMIDQQQQDDLDRSFKLPQTIQSSDFDTEFPVGMVGNPGASLIVNATGDGFEAGPTATSIAAHEADTTNIHGIADTSALALTADSVQKSGDSMTGMLAFNQQVDSSSSGAGVSLAPTKSIIKITGAVTSINNITSPADGKLLILINGAGGAVTIVNNSGGTAANRIYTGTGADLVINDGSSIWLSYDSNSSRWRVVGGSGGTTATVGSDLTLTAGDTLAITLTDLIQVYRVQGNAAAISMSTTNPFGASAPANGTLVEVIGNDDTNTVTFTYSDTSLGLVGNFSTIELAKYQVAAFRYNTTLDRFVLAYRS